MDQFSSSSDITSLLQAWSDGDQAAYERLVPLIQVKMRQLAGEYLRRERRGHILQPTALINEVHLKLLDWQKVRFHDRANFFGVAAMLMRRVLVDYARHYPDLAGKIIKLDLDDAESLPNERSAHLLALDEALKALAEIDPRRGRIVELRFFGGLSMNQTAEVLNLSPRTIAREWQLARAWLYRELTRTAAKDALQP